jgi:hypothetical protein
MMGCLLHLNNNENICNIREHILIYRFDEFLYLRVLQEFSYVSGAGRAFLHNLL